MFNVQGSMNVLTDRRLTRLAMCSTGIAPRSVSQRPIVFTNPDTPKSHTSHTSRR